MPATPRSKKLHVAITGANGSLGRLALARLLASPRIERVTALDLAEPGLRDARLGFVPVDLARARAGDELGEALRRAPADVVLHLAFFSSPVRDPAYAHEVEVIGTGHLLAACAAARIKSLVVASTTLVYGAGPQNPNFLTEDRPLATSPQSRSVADRIEAEQQVRAYRRSHPGMRSAVLRLAPVIGPSVDTPATRFLHRSVAPVVFGHDPLVQCLHEDDASEALLLAALAGRAGDYNICCRGVLRLSTALRLAGTAALPLPFPIAAASLRALNAMGVTAVPTRMLDALRYLWVADGTKAERDLGFRPRYGVRETLLSFAQARGHAAA